MAVTAIVEFQVVAGQRDAFMGEMRALYASMTTPPPGLLGSTLYEVVGNPDGVVEIAEWESLGARDAFMAQLQESGALAPFMPLLAAPFKATIIRPLS